MRFTSGVTAMTIGWAWRWELEAVHNLLGNAYRLQSNSKEPADYIDSTLTLLMLGVEKALKLAVGCCHVRDTGASWPAHLSKPGHHSAQLQTNLLRKALKALSGSSNERAAREIVEQVKSDAVWQFMIEVRDLYGSGGRFHYLDVLAQNPKRVRLGGPQESWLVILMAAMEYVGRDFDDSTPIDIWELATNAAICASIRMWWESMARLGELGAFGEMGVELAAGLRPLT
jgi:hypothetical protein